jgi:hypothetical protein
MNAPNNWKTSKPESGEMSLTGESEPKLGHWLEIRRPELVPYCLKRMIHRIDSALP